MAAKGRVMGTAASVKPHVELLVTPACPSCEEAERVWRDVSRALGLTLVVRSLEPDPEHPEAGTRALPVLMIDGRPLVVGVPEADDARRLLEQAMLEG